MRIAFVTRNYGRAGGGSEAYIAALSRHLIALGHELHVFSDIAGREGDPAAVFHPVAIPHALSVLAVRAFAQRSARQLDAWEARNGPFDIVAGFGKVLRHDVYRAGGGVHRKYLQTRRWPWLQARWNPLHRTILNIEDRLFSPDHPAHIICNARMVQREIQQVYGLPDSKFTVIYNGVDTDRFTPVLREQQRPVVRRALGVDDEDLLLLFVGTGWVRKGLDVLVHAMALLRTRSPQARWTLVVVGRGDPVPYLRIARKAGVPAGEAERRILFAGAQRDTERWYAAADIAVLPTRYDAGANVVQEALASGLPMVTTSTNGTAELIDATCGAVVDGTALEPQALAAAIERFADPAARAAAGEAARARALGLRTLDNALRTLDVYQRVAAAKRAV